MLRAADESEQFKALERRVLKAFALFSGNLLPLDFFSCRLW